MLQVVFVVMSLHPVRLPGLHWGCSRPGHRLQRRARQAGLYSRAIPCRGHCRPFHDQAQGEPSWRGQVPAQGLGVVPTEGNRGAFKVAPAAALLRRPDLALAAAGALAAAAAATAHLASRARTLGAPPPGQPRQSAERPARWQRCQGRRWCWREGGERVAPRAGEECYVGRRAPRPRAGRTRRRGGARGERGAGARVSPPPRRAGREGRGRGACRCSLFVRRGAGRGGGPAALSSPGGDARSRVGRGGGVGDRQCSCPLPERPALTLRNYCGPSAASLGRSASDKGRRSPRPQRRQRTEPGSRSVARGCSLLGHPSSCLLWCGGGRQARWSRGRLG